MYTECMGRVVRCKGRCGDVDVHGGHDFLAVEIASGAIRPSEVVEPAKARRRAGSSTWLWLGLEGAVRSSAISRARAAYWEG